MDAFAPGVPDPHQPQVAIGTEIWRDLGTRRLATQVGLGLCALLSLPMIGSELGFLVVGMESDTGLLLSLTYLPLLALNIVALLATAIAWSMWSYRLAKNVRAVNDPETASLLKFTPGWVVGWWFVPFAAFWMPLRVHQELWPT